MAQDIKKIIAQEYIKCAKDPAYFMKKVLPYTAPY